MTTLQRVDSDQATLQERLSHVQHLMQSVVSTEDEVRSAVSNLFSEEKQRLFYIARDEAPVGTLRGQHGHEIIEAHPKGDTAIRAIAVYIRQVPR